GHPNEPPEASMFTMPGPLDFIAVARTTLEFWEREQVFPRLVAKNRGGSRFSFLDGPITANNLMGVHHAWGRTYKDVVQRYKALAGYEQRFQNGFDCHGRGWLYRGHRPMPWCARCGTSISQHEMLDAYAELTHESVTVALPLLDRADHCLLVWTTTPWTLPANVAVAVNPELDYAECAQAGIVYYLATSLVGRYPALGQPRRTVKG